MTYGLSPRVFIEDGPAVQVAKARSAPFDGAVRGALSTPTAGSLRSSGRSSPPTTSSTAFPLAL